MKTIFLTIFAASLALTSCHKTDISSVIAPPLELASPMIKVSEYHQPFVGVVEIYPSAPSTDIYVGNYIDNPLMVRTQPALYLIGVNGTVSAAPSLLLPVGSYTLTYWGVPHGGDTTYTEPQVVNPAIGLGVKLGDMTLSLRKNGSDTTYNPTYDYVYALRNIEIGRDSIDVSLRRVVAGIRVVARNSDGAPLSSAINSITAQVSGVSGALNFFTATTQGNPVTVAFNLTIAQDRASAYNLTAMVFPSSPNPTLTLIVKLSNGSQHVMRTTLANALTANNRLTIDLKLNHIVDSSPSGSGFTVSTWNETTEQITL